MRVPDRAEISHKKWLSVTFIVLESQAVESHHQISKVGLYVLMFASESRCDNKEET